MPKALFLDGIGCNPHGFKPRFLRVNGYTVEAPMLPDLDFQKSVEIANQAVRTFQPDVIIGYSRGGAVAMTLEDNEIPRLLIAPALKHVPEDRCFDGPLVILSSPKDDGIPLEDVRQFLFTRYGSDAYLQEVGADNTMIDTEALDALLHGLSQLLN